MEQFRPSEREEGCQFFIEDTCDDRDEETISQLHNRSGIFDGMDEEAHRVKVVQTIETFTRSLVQQWEEGGSLIPTALMNLCPQRNCEVDDLLLARFLAVLAEICDTAREKKRVCQRSLMYRVKDSKRLIFPNEQSFTKTLYQICEIFQCSRDDLFIMTSSRGIVGGCLEVTDSFGIVHDCRKTPFMIPGCIDEIEKMTFRPLAARARLLIIEKETVFQHLNDADFFDEDKDGVASVMVTGRGFPSISTRAFIQMLVDTCRNDDGVQSFPHPLVLTDYNPDGARIVMTYRGIVQPRGKISEEQLRYSLPHAEWLGIHYQDIREFIEMKSEESTSGVLELTLRDKVLIESFRQTSQTNGNYDNAMLTELMSMLRFGYKAEIESFISRSNLEFAFTDFLKRIILTPSTCRRHLRKKYFESISTTNLKPISVRQQ